MMWFLNSYLHDIQIAVSSILSNKLKSFLTALGIIFGVAAVITMMAIGKGAEVEILEEIKMIGVNNILILPIIHESKNENNSSSVSKEEEGEKQIKKYGPGLTMADMEGIKKILPSIKYITPEVVISNYLIQSGVKQNAKILGVSNDYFPIYNLKLQKGAFFNSVQEENGMAVCVIGSNVKNKFFPQSDPIGQSIKFGKIWLRIIGVLEQNNVRLVEDQSIGVNVINDNIFIPIKSILLRFHNRALVSSESIRNSTAQNMSENQISEDKNYNQLEKIIVQVNKSEEILPTVDVLNRMLLRRHAEVKNFQISVPELLLKQQQKTKEIFNIVLGAIASISLIVGGIGIMNIMFASVMERIKEIGIRMAIGARKSDIIVQFLAEAVLISVFGGVIGIILGIVASKLITHFTSIHTIVSLFSVFIAFFVSVSIGIAFGYYPARGASKRDPIQSLRYE